MNLVMLAEVAMMRMPGYLRSRNGIEEEMEAEMIIGLTTTAMTIRWE